VTFLLRVDGLHARSGGRKTGEEGAEGEDGVASDGRGPNRGHLERKSTYPDLALTVLHVPYSLDSGARQR